MKSLTLIIKGDPLVVTSPKSKQERTEAVATCTEIECDNGRTYGVGSTRTGSSIYLYDFDTRLKDLKT